MATHQPRPPTRMAPPHQDYGLPCVSQLQPPHRDGGAHPAPPTTLTPPDSHDWDDFTTLKWTEGGEGEIFDSVESFCLSIHQALMSREQTHLLCWSPLTVSFIFHIRRTHFINFHKMHSTYNMYILPVWPDSLDRYLNPAGFSAGPSRGYT